MKSKTGQNTSSMKFSKTDSTSYRYTAIFLWALMALFVSINHEIWRDEMRALSVSTLHDSFFDLVNDLKNEGHPILWYFLLKIAYFLIPNPIVLKAIAFLIGFASIFLVIFYIRLPLYISTIFIFTNVMMFENTIMCRNYGISALLLILFLLFNERAHRTICLILIALLVQTNLIGAIVGLFLFLILIQDLIKRRPFNYKLLIAILIAMCLSFALFYITTKTNELSYFHYNHSIEPIDLMQNIFKSLVYPSKVFAPFIANSPFLSTLAILLLTYTLSVKRFDALLFYCCAVLINLINLQVYTLSSRHIGVFIVFFFILYARGFESISALNSQSIYHKTLRFSNRILVPLLFFILLVSNFTQCIEDIFHERSSSKKLAQFISENDKYSKCILMSEPDFYIESLPYYLKNKIFLLRERKFASYTSFSKLNRDSIELREIIHVSDSLKSIHNTSVLILFKDFDFNNPEMKQKYIVYIPKVLTWTQNDLLRLKLVKNFDEAIGDENYKLYEII